MSTRPHAAPLLRTVRPAVRRAALVLFTVLAASVAIHLAYACFDVGRATMAPWIDRWDVMAGVLAVTGLCVLRAVAVAEHRAAWLAMGASIAFWALGLLYFSVHDYWLPEPPYPSGADAAWLTAYLPIYASIMLLVRAGLPRAHPSVWLDGLVGALALSAHLFARPLPAAELTGWLRAAAARPAAAAR